MRFCLMSPLTFDFIRLPKVSNNKIMRHIVKYFQTLYRLGYNITTILLISRSLLFHRVW